jgi:hypothetical protein
VRVFVAPQARESVFPLPLAETLVVKRLGRAIQTMSRHKSRKAGERALRYIFYPEFIIQLSPFALHNSLRPCEYFLPTAITEV